MSALFAREFLIGSISQLSPFASNVVITSRYTALNFIPKNLFEQFHLLPNVYFLLIGVLQAIPAISATRGVPTIYLPLIIILAVSAIRAALEDLRRHSDDHEQNSKLFQAVGIGPTSNAHVSQRETTTPVSETELVTIASSPRGSGVPVSPTESLRTLASGDICVGDIACRLHSATVMIVQNQEIPADAILLYSSHPKGVCFVETASLDGETSLKVKVSPAALQVAVRERATRKHGDDQSHGMLSVAIGSSSGQLAPAASPLESRPAAAANSSVAAPDVARVLSKLRGRVRCEAPNAQFDQFKGRLTIEGVDGFFSELASRDETSLDSSHLLLRGTVVKNTAFVFALVAYTGVESKIRKNCERVGAETSSQSRLMLIMNRLICFQFFAQLIFCAVAAILASTEASDLMSGTTDFPPPPHSPGHPAPPEALAGAWYLKLSGSASTEGFTRFWSWIIILQTMVPIALLVSSEVAKTGQKIFMQWDRSFYDARTGKSLIVQSSTLNEDLGQIERIFSDKTGTLTQNIMEFKVAIVGATPFGSAETDISKRVEARNADQRAATRQRRNSPISASPSGSIDSAESDMESPPKPRRRWSQLTAPLNKRDSRSPSITESVSDSTQIGISSSASAAISDSAPSNLQMRDALLDLLWPRDDSKQAAAVSASVRGYLLQLAVNNTIVPIEDASTGRVEYQAASPDELALCQFAASMGFELYHREPTRVRIRSFGRRSSTIDEIVEFEQLGVFDFNSKRKRATLVYRSLADGRVHVMTKGADSVLVDMLRDSKRFIASAASAAPLFKVEAGIQEPIVDDESASRVLGLLPALINQLADSGLRTLVLAEANVSFDWWNDCVRAEYAEAITMPEEGTEAAHSRGGCAAQCRICMCFARAEQGAGLRLLGATAIEDKLQDLVPETIADLLDASIKVYMLTGDKRQTAKNIALACNLIDPDMEPSQTAPGDEIATAPNRHTPTSPGAFSQTSDSSRVHRGSQLNRLVEIVGSWNSRLDEEAHLRSLYTRLSGAKFSPQNSTDDFTVEVMCERLVSDMYLPAPLVELVRAKASRWADEQPSRAASSSSLSTPAHSVVQFDSFAHIMRQCRISELDAVRIDIATGVTLARALGARHPRLDLASDTDATDSGDGDDASSSNSALRLPISIVLEGSAMTSLYAPITAECARGSLFAEPHVAPRCEPASLHLESAAQSASLPNRIYSARAAGADSGYTEGNDHACDAEVHTTDLRHLFYDFVAPDDASRAADDEMLIALAERAQARARDDLFWLFGLCKSTVACRLTPAQKAAFVAESQQRAPDALTLAIGDGANDEQMIRQADVGVGLSGLEGSAAARASDFSVSHFRSLHTLLLVHGIWNYRRMALVVQYVFYKSTLQAAVAFLFGFVSAFSGQQFVNDIHVQLYGVLFTALPTVVVGILDQALPRHVVENSPHAYRSVRRGALFNLGTFSGWIARAFAHAAITFFITKAAMGDAPDVLQWSNAQFSAQVFVVNIEILLHAHSVTFVTVASVVFANFTLMLVSFITSQGQFALGFSPNFLGIFRMTAAMPSAVLACALSIVCAHAVSFVWQYVNVTWFPSFIDKLRDRHAHDDAED